MPAPIVTVAGGVRLEARPVRSGSRMKVLVELYDVRQEERLCAEYGDPANARLVAKILRFECFDDELADLQLWLGRIGVAFTAAAHELEEQLAAGEAERVKLRNTVAAAHQPTGIMRLPKSA